ncbi:hypothetical protein EMIT0324P_100175 [Pseudomonas chlororaphis]
MPNNAGARPMPIQPAHWSRCFCMVPCVPACRTSVRPRRKRLFGCECAPSEMAERFADAGNRGVLGLMVNRLVRRLKLKIDGARDQGDNQESGQEPAHLVPPSSSLGLNAGLLLLVIRVWSPAGVKALQIAPVIVQILPGARVARSGNRRESGRQPRAWPRPMAHSRA